MRHTTVAKEPGRFKAWPANGGLWAWGDEVLCLYYDGKTDFTNPRDHAVDMDKPLWMEQARSQDGGVTWKIERDPLPRPTRRNVTDLPTGLDFSDPDLILCFKMTHWSRGQSFLYYSRNRGQKWHGPFRLPSFGRGMVNARTAYLTRGRHECHAFVSGAPKNGREDGCETFLIRTTDGGKTWTEVSRVGRVTLPAGGANVAFTIMPSAVRIGMREIVCLMRCTDTRKTPRGWIEAWHSPDDGIHWQFRSRIEVGDQTQRFGGGSSPPALSLLPDGTLVVTYGHRFPPYGIRARTSRDKGRTWSDPITLRADAGNFDIGYPRNVLLDSGELLTVYYFNRDPKQDRSIEATRWKPM